MCLPTHTFGATIVLNSCPYDSISSGNTYVLSDDFIWSMPSYYCFLLNKTLTNVSFDGNFTHFGASDLGNANNLFYIKYSNYGVVALTGITIMNFNISNSDYVMNITPILIDGTNTNISITSLYVANNSFSDVTRIFANFNSQIETTNTYLDFTLLDIRNNYFKTQYGAMWDMYSINDVSGQAIIRMNYFNMYNNDIESVRDKDYTSLFNDPATGMLGSVKIIDYAEIYNNNFAFRSTGCTNNGGFTCSGITFVVDGTFELDIYYLGSLEPLSTITDTDHDGFTDQSITLDADSGTGSTTYWSDPMPTISQPQSTMNPEPSKYYINRVWSYASFYEDQKTYQLTQPLTLNSTMYLNFEDVQFATLDCSHLSTCFYLTNVNQIKGGSNNILTGNEIYRSKIYSTGTIDIGGFSISSPFSTTYQLITFTNNFELSNIELLDQAVGEHGIIRKKVQASNGRLILENNYFNFQRVQTDKTMPFFYMGFGCIISDNTFQFNAVDVGTQYIFYGGVAGSLSITGGHTISGNEFLSSGLILSKIVEYGGDYSSGSIYPSQIYNNNFAGYGTSFYSYPFSLAGNNSFGRALMINPFLNYSHAVYFANSCDAYFFNIGNYYEFWDDGGALNDSNSDDISDIPLNVGYDFIGNFIIDYRPLMSYPYDFGAKLGFAEFYDMCKYFEYNISSPIQNYTYNSSVFASNWKFSSEYDDLWCYETLQDDDYLVTDSGDTDTSYGNTYNLITGYYNWKLTCCNDYSCSGLKKESEPIFFCINSCSPRGEVVDYSSTVYGCMDTNANNYNPLATVNDGSCTYDDDDDDDEGGGLNVNFENVDVGDLFSSDLETSKTAFGNILKNIGTVFILLFWISMVFVSMAILFIILYILFFAISLIYALFGGGRKG